MKSYINGIGMISPQKSFGGEGFLSDVVEHHAEFLRCIDPNYKEYIDPLAARRMSRIIKMGITSAKMCLTDAGFFMTGAEGRQEFLTPDAIITGTGLGSVEDTEKILNSMMNGEQLLNPTPFIQSTYNTISSQIAINLKCHSYNSTYVHRSFSFESGLLDALLQISEGKAKNVLVGGIDEMTLNHLNIIRRLGQFRMSPVSNLDLLKYEAPGTLAGEGSGYFLLSAGKSDRTYAALSALHTFYKPANYEEIRNQTRNFLAKHNLDPGDISIFLTGLNGNRDSDLVYYDLSKDLFPGVPLAWFKHLCGEYHTASSFALWVAANCIKSNSCPSILKVSRAASEKIRNVLIYNHYNRVNHSLILLTAAE